MMELNIEVVVCFGGGNFGVFGLDADVLLTASLVNRPRDQSISLPSLELSLPMTLWLETRVRGHWL
jgi:hypothetical protein